MGNLKLITPSSVLTRPADTTGYSQNDLIASSTTAASIVVPSFSTALLSNGNPIMIRKFRLITNKTSGMTTAQFLVEFWSAAPTFTNGDNAAYAVATGAANWIGSSTTTIMTGVADGAYCSGVPTTGSEWGISLATGILYWSLKEVDATGFATASGQTFTLIPEVYSD